YIFGICGGARFRRGRGNVVVVLRDDHAHRPECADGVRTVGYVYLYGSSCIVAVTHSDQRRDGGGAAARDWHPPSLHERRRFQYLVEFLSIRAGQQCPAQKVCELKITGA